MVLEQIKQIVDPLLLSDADVDRLMSTLLREMECGLSRDPLQRRLTSLQMENTYVRSLLDGKGPSCCCHRIITIIIFHCRIDFLIYAYICARMRISMLHHIT